MQRKNNYYTILDALPDHIFVFSESGEYVDVFGGDENATEFDCKPFIGKKLHDIAPPEMADMFLSFITKTLAKNTTQRVKYRFGEDEMIDLPAHIPNPQEIWFEGTIKPLPIEWKNQRTVLWIAKNITQQHILEQRLKLLSELDELTNIYNRRSISLALKEAIDEYHQYGHSFSLIMFDIDKFKRINDTLGHPIGDDVINHVVDIAKTQLRTTDSIGRLGGEEFLVILRDSGVESAWGIAERIRTEIQKTPYSYEQYDIHVTVSIGITEVIPEDLLSKSIIARADLAMYYSKERGRNQTNQYTSLLEASESDISRYNWLTTKSKQGTCPTD